MPIEIELYQFERSKVWHLGPKQIDITVIVKKWTFRNKLDEHRTVSIINQNWWDKESTNMR